MDPTNATPASLNIVNPIYDLDEFLPLTTNWLSDPISRLRAYFTTHYFLATDVNEGDLTIRQAPNKLCVISLAKRHPGRGSGKDDLSPLSITFSDFKGIVGKNKKHAPTVNSISPLAEITTADGNIHIVRAAVHGQVMELNERLLKEPMLMRQKPDTEGFIAIIKPKIENSEKALSHCVTEEKWHEKDGDHVMNA
ncbi:hypothetical protein BC936DRAFT_149507 [Jimgerdemannia flammicorona]|uniref:Protein Abitram n=1 Tax=Jimgerdemannia flammicorona TaxID=994334 RepID=A0A433DKF7_9FUNG|nr:hypothetical protein BC936DRAFT_149507 [Jimgerdemannia flammicorona]